MNGEMKNKIFIIYATSSSYTSRKVAMIFSKSIIFLLACLALICSDATLMKQQLYYNQSSIITCVVVPVAEEAQEAPDKLAGTSKTPREFRKHLIKTGILTEDRHENISTNNNSSLPEAVIQVPVEAKERMKKKPIVIQYYATAKESKVLFFAGECFISPEYLQHGYHKLSIQEIVYNKKLWLEIWWDDQKMHFETNMNRPIWSDMYEPSYFALLSPADFEVPEDAVCEDVLNAMALTSDQMPYQLAVVASSIIGVLVLLSVVALLLARRYWKSETLRIAGHRAKPQEISNYVAGFDRSYNGASIGEDFQYQPIETR